MFVTAMPPTTLMNGTWPTIGSPVGNCTRASVMLPHVGTAHGLVVDGGVFHDRTARIFATGETWQGRRCGARFTGRNTAYWMPPAGMGSSCTRTWAVPRYWSKLPLFSQSAQKATYSTLPAVQSPPE